jgi:hypothetical protein
MLSKFQHLKPWFIKRLKEWNTCTCWYHNELNELKIGLDTMQVVGKDVHICCGCKCENICEHELNITSGELCCTTHVQIPKTLTSLWSSILCSKGKTIEFHKRECIMSDYPRCGIQLLKVCPEELVNHKKTQWRNIGHKVVGATIDGWEKKVSGVMYNDTTPIDLIQYLKPQLSNFVLHNFIVHW